MMMKSMLSIMALLLGVAAGSATELTVRDVTAGNLNALVTNPEEVTALHVEGTIDVRDLDYIANSLPSLTKLFLENASIAEYNGLMPLTQQSIFPANTLPPMTLAGLQLTTLLLPTNLTAIGDGALAGIPAESITLPSTLTTIGVGAFQGCTGLKVANLPSTITTVGARAYEGCTALTRVDYHPTYIPDGCFRGCTALADITVYRELTTIGNNAFEGDLSLTELKGSYSGVQTIGADAFRASGLRSMNLSKNESLTTIGDRAFADCQGLTTLILPSSVTEIGSAMLWEAENLTTYEPSENVTRVPDMVLKGAKSLDSSDFIGDGVTTIGRYAFSGNESLTEVNLPAGLDSIGSRAFDGVYALQNIQAGDVDKVPAVVDDSFGDIDRPTVTLLAAPAMVQQFKDTPIWKDFNVRDITSDTPTILDELGVDASGRLNLHMEGTRLVIESSDPMAQVDIYNTEGAELWSATVGGSHNVTVETDRWSSPVLLLRVVTENDRVLSAKIKH